MKKRTLQQLGMHALSGLIMAMPMIMIPTMQSQSLPENDRSLSPYFMIPDGDPSTDRIPLLSTSGRGWWLWAPYLCSSSIACLEVIFSVLMVSSFAEFTVNTEEDRRYSSASLTGRVSVSKKPAAVLIKNFSGEYKLLNPVCH